MLKIKICGLKSLEDALAALEAGADLLGFNFYQPSPRYIAPADCIRLVDALRRRGIGATLVGVFVNPSLAFVRQILSDCDLDLAQLSGDEPPELLHALGERAFKALRPADPAALAEDLRRFPPRNQPPAWLFDAHRPGQYGGTGQTADWSLAHHLAAQAPILLAGGLTPANVAAAVRQVRPWGVDTASGVEASPGRKDPQKMVEFVRAARSSPEPDTVDLQASPQRSSSRTLPKGVPDATGHLS